MSDVCVCECARALSDVWAGVYRADPKVRLRGVYTKL